MTYTPGQYGQTGLVLVVFAATIFQPHLVKAQLQSPSVEKLHQEISNRDTVISDLMRRVEALEQKLGKTAVPEQPSGAAEITQPAGTETAMAIGEEDTARALERTLVRERAIVLPPWSVEVEPRYTYTYQGKQDVRLALAGGQQVIAQRNLKRDISESRLDVRFGLPWSSQLDVAVPYSFIQEEAVRGGSSKRRRSGLGDVQLGWTKAVVIRERLVAGPAHDSQLEKQNGWNGRRQRIPRHSSRFNGGEKARSARVLWLRCTQLEFITKPRRE